MLSYVLMIHVWLLQALLLVLSGRGAFRDATVTLNSIGRF